MGLVVGVGGGLVVVVCFGWLLSGVLVVVVNVEWVLLGLWLGVKLVLLEWDGCWWMWL